MLLKSLQKDEKRPMRLCRIAIVAWLSCSMKVIVDRHFEPLAGEKSVHFGPAAGRLPRRSFNEGGSIFFSYLLSLVSRLLAKTNPISKQKKH